MNNKMRKTGKSKGGWAVEGGRVEGEATWEAELVLRFREHKM